MVGEFNNFVDDADLMGEVWVIRLGGVLGSGIVVVIIVIVKISSDWGALLLGLAWTVPPVATVVVILSGTQGVISLLLVCATIPAAAD